MLKNLSAKPFNLLPFAPFFADRGSWSEDATEEFQLVRRVVLSLTREFFKRLALRLGDQERGEHSTEHKERVNLHQPVDPRMLILCRAALVCQRINGILAYQRTDFACGGRKAIGGGTNMRWKAFARDDEGYGIGALISY